mmetsp:Transcript_162608/g.521306  ORF Transcript_162608/g.521306 Transcript_162608/m.521306 type:complete len:316 (+) Transcript_162608:379-1326(+)
MKQSVDQSSELLCPGHIVHDVCGQQDLSTPQQPPHIVVAARTFCPPGRLRRRRLPLDNSSTDLATLVECTIETEGLLAVVHGVEAAIGAEHRGRAQPRGQQRAEPEARAQLADGAAGHELRPRQQQVAEHQGACPQLETDMLQVGRGQPPHLDPPADESGGGGGHSNASLAAPAAARAAAGRGRRRGARRRRGRRRSCGPPRQRQVAVLVLDHRGPRRLHHEHRGAPAGAEALQPGQLLQREAIRLDDAADVPPLRAALVVGALGRGVVLWPPRPHAEVPRAPCYGRRRRFRRQGQGRRHGERSDAPASPDVHKA